jgi:hypothetical protein
MLSYLMSASRSTGHTLGSAESKRWKAQSSMENLAPYGWVLLILILLLAALWQAGVFNTSHQAPREQPGSCKVSKQMVFGSGVQVSMVGSCGNMLPKFVAQFSGTNSYIGIPYYGTLYPAQSITVSLWFKTTEPIITTSQLLNTASIGTDCVDGAYCMRMANSSIYFGVRTPSGGWQSTYAASTQLQSAQQINGGNWNNVVGVYDGSKVYIYWDGTLENSVAATGAMLLDTNDITVADTFGENYQGSISNVQIYNISLSASEVQKLYDEGIGGVPLPLPNIEGWWPLNGDVVDYSGSGLNGGLTGVVMNSSWSSGYMTP